MFKIYLFKFIFFRIEALSFVKPIVEALVDDGIRVKASTFVKPIPEALVDDGIGVQVLI